MVDFQSFSMPEITEINHLKKLLKKKIMKTLVTKSSVKAYVTAFTVMAFVVFTIFQFLQSSDIEKLIMIDFRMIFAGGIYCLVGILLCTRVAAIPFGILMLAAGGFLLYSYFYFFNFGSFALENANPYLLTFGLLASLGIIFGVKLYQRNDGLDRMGANFMLSVSAICILFIIADYTLPKPAKIDFAGVMIIMIFAVMVIGASIASHAFRETGSKYFWIPTIIYRLVSIGAMFFILLTLNNVVYNGCYPSSPIGCPCNLRQQEILPIESQSSPKDSIAIQPPVSSQSVSENILIPKGGSLCGTLGMTPKEALEFAKTQNLKYWWKNGTLYVLVYPGDVFHKVNDHWEAVSH